MLVIFADDERQVRRTTVGWIESLYPPLDKEKLAEFESDVEEARNRVGRASDHDHAIIRAEGLRFLICSDLSTIMQRVEEHKKSKEPILFLLDLAWGAQKSFGLLDELKAGNYRHWPTVIYTKSEDQEDVNESYRRLANAYLKKPDTAAKRKEAFSDLVDVWRARFTSPPTEINA